MHTMSARNAPVPSAGIAGVAQWLERHVANVNVEGSNPFTRSGAPGGAPDSFCAAAILAACSVKGAARQGAGLVMFRFLDAIFPGTSGCEYPIR